MKRLIFILLLIIVFILYLVKTTRTPEYYSKLRQKNLKNAKEVYIAAVWPDNRKDLYKNGVKLAEKEINGKGGILGKKLIIDFYLYSHKENRLNVVRKITENPKYTATIGYYYSSLTSKAAVICQLSGLLLMSNGAIDTTITEHRFPFIFRNMANTKLLAEAIVKFFKKRNKTKISIIYSTSRVARQIVGYIMQFGDFTGIKVVSSYILAKSVRDYRKIIASIKIDNPDALFMIVSRKQAIKFLKEMHEMAFKRPIVASDTVDDEYLLQKVGGIAEGLVTYSMFSPKYNTKKVKKFIENFRKEYNFMPDSWAALGYDAVKVLAYTMEKVKSIRPIPIAAMLPYINWDGCLGSYHFSYSGDVVNKKIFFKQIKNGRFVYLEEYYDTD